MQDHNHLSQPFTWQQFSHHHQLPWTRHYNWLLQRQRTKHRASVLCQAVQATRTSNEQQPPSPPTEEKNKTLGNFWKNVREILVSCSAPALWLGSGPVQAGLWAQCTCWGSQGNGAGDPRAVGTALHTASSSHTAGKTQKQQGKKWREGKKKASSFSARETGNWI